MIEFEKFEKFWKEDRKSFLVAIAVALITIFEDASIGILVGATLALLFFVDRLSKGEYEVFLGGSKKKPFYHEHGSSFKCTDEDIETVVYSVEGILVYLDATSHLDNLEKISQAKNVKNVVLRLRDLFCVDVDGLEVLVEGVEKLKNSGKNVYFTMPRPEVLKVLKKTEFFKQAEKDKAVFEKTKPALDCRASCRPGRCDVADFVTPDDLSDPGTVAHVEPTARHRGWLVRVLTLPSGDGRWGRPVLVAHPGPGAHPRRAGSVVVTRVTAWGEAAGWPCGADLLRLRREVDLAEDDPPWDEEVRAVNALLAECDRRGDP